MSFLFAFQCWHLKLDVSQARLSQWVMQSQALGATGLECDELSAAGSSVFWC